MPVRDKGSVVRPRGSEMSLPVRGAQPMTASLPIWSVPANSPITAQITAPPDTSLGGHVFGARIEDTPNRQIESYWRPATLEGDVYTVTLDGVVSPGVYNFVWMTDASEPNPDYSAFIPILITDPTATSVNPFVSVDPVQITPTVAEIATLLGTRTVDQISGENVGTFNANTFPTDAQVSAVIVDAVSDVMAQIPNEIDPAAYPAARLAVKLLSAIYVEESFFRNDAQTVGLTTRLNATMTSLSETTVATGQRLR